MKAHYLDYWYITICLDWLDILLVDSDVSLSIVLVIDKRIDLNIANISKEAVLSKSTSILLSLNSQSIVSNLNVTTTEVKLILEGISG